MFQLPVSGLTVTIRQPTGWEDLLLQETHASAMAASLALAGSLVRSTNDIPSDWLDLTMADLEALMLLLRRAVLGNSVRAGTRCTHADCGARVDVHFRIDEYLAGHKPRRPRSVEKSDERGWFCLQGGAARFRLPRCRDIVEARDGSGRSDPAVARRGLFLRCIEPADIPRGWHKRIERAMEAIATPLSGDLAGTCPECGLSLNIYFDVVSFVLRELREQAAGVYQDVHLLALHYKWPEEKILALPRNRRQQYAEMIRDERSAA